MQHSEIHNEEGTIKNKKRLNKYYLNFFQDKKLNELTRLLIQQWYDNLVSSKSPYIVNDSVKLLKASFNYAKKLGIIKENPFEFLSKVPIPKKIRNRLHLSKYKELLTLCKEKKPEYYLLFVLASLTGMRVGEYIALTTNDIDKIEKEIKVDKQLYRGKIKKTKTYNSTRIVYFSNVVLDAIEYHRKKYNIFGGYLFPSRIKKGFPLSAKTVDRYFKNLLKLAGYPEHYMRLHDLRGQYVDIMHSQGIPTVQISRQVGHSSTRITNDVYSSILSDVNEATKSAIDRALGLEG